MRGCFREFGLNCSENAVDIAQHVVVPETKDLVAFLSQAFVSNRICCGLIVLPTVDFNDETLLAAHEITDVADDRLLPDKLVAVDPPVADAIPENRLCICLIDAQSSCASDGLLIVATHCPAPHPGLHRTMLRIAGGNPTSPRKERGEV